MQKHHLNNCWTGKDPLLPPYIYTPYGSPPTSEYYQRCKSTIFRFWGNVNVFRDNQVLNQLIICDPN